MKNLIIGLDGVPNSLLKDFIDKDYMPNLKLIIDKGQMFSVKSSLPEISNVSWSSIITGKNSGEHGIFGFMEFAENSYDLTFPNYNDLKSLSFWEINNNRKSVIVNVPSTFPANNNNGDIISGFVSLDLNRSVYPKSNLNFLEQIGYKIDVDAAKAHESMNLFLDDLNKVLDVRIKLFDIWIKEKEWDDFMFVITGTDRLLHFLWSAYENENSEYHNEFIKYFKKIDMFFGKILKVLNDNISLTIMSDHGFEGIETEVFLNKLLIEKGYLSLENNKNISSINNKTSAFILDPARVYLNKKNKYPNGKLEGNEKEILDELKSFFEELQFNGKKVIAKVYEKEEIYYGDYINKAPDLVLLPGKGFSFRANLNSQNIFEEPGIFTGKHTYHDTTLIYNNVNKKEIDDKIQNSLKEIVL